MRDFTYRSMADACENEYTVMQSGAQKVYLRGEVHGKSPLIQKIHPQNTYVLHEKYIFERSEDELRVQLQPSQLSETQTLFDIRNDLFPAITNGTDQRQTFDMWEWKNYIAFATNDIRGTIRRHFIDPAMYFVSRLLKQTPDEDANKNTSEEVKTKMNDVVSALQKLEANEDKKYAKIIRDYVSIAACSVYALDAYVFDKPISRDVLQYVYTNVPATCVDIVLLIELSNAILHGHDPVTVYAGVFHTERARWFLEQLGWETVSDACSATMNTDRVAHERADTHHENTKDVVKLFNYALPETYESPDGRQHEFPGSLAYEYRVIGGRDSGLKENIMATLNTNNTMGRIEVNGDSTFIVRNQTPKDVMNRLRDKIQVMELGETIIENLLHDGECGASWTRTCTVVRITSSDYTQQQLRNALDSHYIIEVTSPAPSFITVLYEARDLNQMLQAFDVPKDFRDKFTTKTQIPEIVFRRWGTRSNAGNEPTALEEPKTPPRCTKRRMMMMQ